MLPPTALEATAATVASMQNIGALHSSAQPVVLGPSQRGGGDTFSHGFPMVFLWYSYNFLIMFPWFSYYFPSIFLLTGWTNVQRVEKVTVNLLEYSESNPV